MRSCADELSDLSPKGSAGQPGRAGTGHGAVPTCSRAAQGPPGNYRAQDALKWMGKSFQKKVSWDRAKSRLWLLQRDLSAAADTLKS